MLCALLTVKQSNLLVLSICTVPYKYLNGFSAAMFINYMPFNLSLVAVVFHVNYSHGHEENHY